MSDTPRTDAVASDLVLLDDMQKCTALSQALFNHARTLERELAEAQAQIKKLELLSRMAALNLDYSKFRRKELAAVIEQLYPKHPILSETPK